jgi:predicted RNase H-like nuclease
MSEVIASTPDAGVVGVDIPIGFPTQGRRQADVAARELLGRRRSSVFLVPPRAVIEAPTYEEARETALRVWDQGVSAQSYALRAKILEVNELGQFDTEIIEVHPEVSFQIIAGGTLAQGKKTWNGQHQRRSLLESEGIIIPERLEGHVGEVPTDDLLDAAVVAWTANRYRKGIAGCLPEGGADSTIWF